METIFHFFSGKMAAGKSTLARKLALEHNAILIVEDDWLAQLYPEEITDIPTYIKYSFRLKNIISDHIITLLKNNISVVLDFPANTEKQRLWFRTIYEQANVAHTLHYLDVSDEKCKKQLKLRSLDKPAGSAFTTDDEFDLITEYFQPPADNEGFNLIRYNS